MKTLLALLAALFMVGCAPPKPAPQTLFELHAATCSQCGGSETGPEGTPVLCAQGFRLLQEDFRRAKEEEQKTQDHQPQRQKEQDKKPSAVGVMMFLNTKNPMWLAF